MDYLIGLIFNEWQYCLAIAQELKRKSQYTLNTKVHLIEDTVLLKWIIELIQ